MRSKSRRSCVRPSVSLTNAEPNHFLKIIPHEAIHCEKTRIPKEFIRRFGNDLSNEVTITVPDGLVWKMGLEKSANDVWICNSWQEFTKYYSLSYGSLLLFKYLGNSNFYMVIFDMSAAEIYYPSKNQSNNEEEQENQEEIICVDDANVRKHGNSSTMENLLRKKKCGIEAARKFKPANPYFTVVVKPAYVNHYMNVPNSFSRTYMRKPCYVKLQETNGKQWVVNCLHQGRSNMRMGKGWVDFARANNLREGDVCVFELIKRKNIVFKVTIFSRT